MKRLARSLVAAAALSMSLGGASASDLDLAKPVSGATMFFADRYASAYYTVDADDFLVTVTVAPGRGGDGNPMRITNRLSDGETATIAIGGFGANEILTTLTLTRTGDNVTADVITDVAGARAQG